MPRPIFQKILDVNTLTIANGFVDALRSKSSGADGGNK